MRESETAKTSHELKRLVLRFKTQKLIMPEIPLRIRVITSEEVEDKLRYSAIGSMFIREIENPCGSARTKFKDAYMDWLGSQGIHGKAFDREVETLEFGDSVWPKLEKQKVFGDFPDAIYSLQTWMKVIVGGAWCEGILNEISKVGMVVLRAGWIPLIWVGRYPDGYLGVYPLPRYSLPVPREWLITKQEKEAAKPVLSKAIDRSGLSVPKITVTAMSAWKRWGSLPVAQGISQALGNLVIGGGKSGKQVVASLAKKGLSLSIGGSAKSPTLIYTFAAKSGKPVTLTGQAPWTGSLVGLPPGFAQVVRQHNGMILSEGAPKPRWIPYSGPATGSKVEWGVWEIEDNHTEPAAWKRKPLAPFSNGSDLWVYHPARMKGETLELVKLDHDGGEWESEPEQHPGVRFLNVVLGVLNVI